jgi:hypothetical protein
MALVINFDFPIEGAKGPHDFRNGTSNRLKFKRVKSCTRTLSQFLNQLVHLSFAAGWTLDQLDKTSDNDEAPFYQERHHIFRIISVNPTTSAVLQDKKTTP